MYPFQAGAQHWIRAGMQNGISKMAQNLKIPP